MKLGPASAPSDVDDGGPVGRNRHRRLPVDGQGRGRGQVDVEPVRRRLAGTGDEGGQQGHDDRGPQAEAALGQGTLGDPLSQSPPTSPALAAGRQLLVGLLVLVQADADLLEVVLAVRRGRGLADLLDGGQQQADQHGDDGDHHQQLDQREAAARWHGKGLLRGQVHRGRRSNGMAVPFGGLL